MKIWLYCSYSGSPTGFRLGCIDPSGKIVKGTPHKLLDRCFSFQGIKDAYGRIPGTSNYVFFRPIERQIGDSLFLNVGFESEEISEYRHICSYFEQFNTNAATFENRERKKNRLRSEEEDALFRKIESIIDKAPDDLDFGIRVDQQNLYSLINEIKSCSLSEKYEKLDDKFYIQFASEMEAESLALNFRLSAMLGEGYRFQKKEPDEGLFVIDHDPATDTQKKTRIGWKNVSALMAIAVIIILIIALSTKNKTKRIEEPRKQETTVVQKLN